MSDPEEYECVGRIRNFSDEKIHTPGSSSLVEMETELRILFFQAYANGTTADDEGYVALDLLRFAGPRCRTSIVVSALDASGNRRFPTSFAFCLERGGGAAAAGERPMLLDRVLKRETVLGEADELLPEDCLTVHVHVFEITRTDEEDAEDPAASFDLPPAADGAARLPLDSRLGRRLVGESSYFRGLSSAPMLERRRGYATFPRREAGDVVKVCEILSGKKDILVYSVEHLLEMYAIADKYDFPTAVAGCGRMLALMLRAAERDGVIEENVKKNVPQILELAEAHGDVRLRSAVQRFRRRNREEEDEDSAAEHLETEWRLEEVDETYCYFTFARDVQGRGDEFDFYQ